MSRRDRGRGGVVALVWCWRVASLAALLLSISATATPAAAAASEPIPFPDTAQMEPAVREQLDAIRRRVEESPNATSFGECGTAYLVYDLAAPAAACLRNAQRLAPGEPRWPYYLGRLLQARGELDAARTALAQARALAPGEPAPVLQLGEAALEQGDLAAARAAFTAAALLAGAKAAATYGLGRVALQEGNAATAAAQLRAALALAPQSGAVRYALAMALRRLGRTDEARALLAAAGREPPPHPDPWADALLALDRGARGHVARGTELLHAGRFPEAEAELRQALEAQPQDATAWQNLAVARERQGDLAGARAAYERTIELQPTAAVAQGNLGALVLGQGEVESGIAWLEKSLANAPDAPGVQFNLAVALLQHGGAAERALSLLEAVLRWRPEDVEARYYLGLALVALQRPADAASELHQVVVAAPAEAAPRLAEARALLAAGDEAAARRRLEEAHATLPNEEALTLELVTVLAAASSAAVRDGSRAWELANALLAQGPTPPREEAAAMALAEMGKSAEAVRHQQQAIALATSAGASTEALQRRLRLYESGAPLRSPWR